MPPHLSTTSPALARVRIIHGKPIKRWCRKCDAIREGIALRERYRWRYKLKCGHIGMGGYVLPLEELERRGYVNYDIGEDPRITARKLQHQENIEREQKERQRHLFFKTELPRGKQFL